MESQQTNIALEQALMGLVQLIKAVRYYPQGHPALQSTGEKALAGFTPLLAAGPLSCTVRRDGIEQNGSSGGSQLSPLKKLALFLFARRIHQLTILPDLSGRDLVTFARCAALEPSDLHKLGGIQELLDRSRVATVSVNEIDLAKILARRDELRNQTSLTASAADSSAPQRARPTQRPGTAQPMEKAPPAPDLTALLRELAQARADSYYRSLLAQLPPLVRQHLTANGRSLALRALSLLHHHAGHPQLSAVRRQLSQQTLDELLTGDAVAFFIDVLCERGVDGKTREKIQDLFAFFEARAAKPLMQRLTEEEDTRARKVLTEALIRLGSSAIPLLLEHLLDPRWYVVRNALVILGEIRDPGTVPRLKPLLRHGDLRVRRETIRALTRIGGDHAMNLLLHMLENGEQELIQQALLSLGAIKNRAAVPTLIRLVEQPDPLLKALEVRRGAIKALGEIGAAEAAPTLLRVLQKRRLWRRSRQDELRAAAALALGEIGGEAVNAALERACRDRSSTLVRAARQALKHQRKELNHGPRIP